MQYDENYGIAAFRSRQQVMRFDSVLRRAGIHAEIVSTPRDVAIGCGLSVAYDLRDTAAVLDAIRRDALSDLFQGWINAQDEYLATREDLYELKS